MPERTLASLEPESTDTRARVEQWGTLEVDGGFLAQSGDNLVAQSGDNLIPQSG